MRHMNTSCTSASCARANATSELISCFSTLYLLAPQSGKQSPWQSTSSDRVAEPLAAPNPLHRADSLRPRRLGLRFILGQARAASASRSCQTLGVTIKMPTQIKKLEAHASHLLDAFIRLRERYSLLDPMLFDPDVPKARGSGIQARGFLTLRHSLFLSCAQIRRRRAT